MNLLSPQHVAQETRLPKDGFQVHANHGILLFGGHQHTVHYNTAKNLPIFFTATNLNKLHITAAPPTIPTTVQAYLSAEDIDSQPTLTSTQHRLLLKHYQLGHLHMACIQQ
jgi:hypothetical protein